MSGIKFCNECLNILVPRETKGEKGLSFVCRSCDYSEQCKDKNSMDEHRISQRNFVQTMTEDLIHDDYCFDPTMPQEKIICPYCRYFKAVYVISREPNDKCLKKTFICANPDCKKKYTSLYYLKLEGDKSDTLAYRIFQPEDIEDGVQDIVLLHGLYTNSYLFERALPELGKKFRVIAPDLRGFGFSSYANEVKDVGDLAQDLVKFFKLLKINKCSIVGWDLGCLVALKFAALKAAVNIQKLVLFNPIPLSGKTYKFDPDLDIYVSEWPEKWEEVEKDPRFLERSRAFMKRDKDKLAKFFLEEIIPFDDLTEDEIDTYIEHFHIQPKGYDNIMKALHSFKFDENFDENLNIETNLIVGGKDTKCPKTEAIAIKDLLGDNCKFSELEDSEHCIVLQNPVEFYEIVDSACSF
jgi:pimeloyl-ACP methyl ester carboxylesterase/DNA-directed RNA polymerase subunit M/transcription elongation factor TFIIS